MSSGSALSFDAAPNTSKTPSLCATKPINGSISSGSSSSIDAGPKIQQVKPLTAKNPKKTREAAIREAKAEIGSKLREDWEYPGPNSVSFEYCQNRRDIQWVLRESDTDPDLAHPTPLAANETDDLGWHKPEPFTPFTAIRTERKRQDRMDEEIEWNAGLRHYIEQRDAWTGARKQEVPFKDVPKDPPYDPFLADAGLANGSSLAVPANTATGLTTAASDNADIRNPASPSYSANPADPTHTPKTNLLPLRRHLQCTCDASVSCNLNEPTLIGSSTTTLLPPSPNPDGNYPLSTCAPSSSFAQNHSPPRPVQETFVPIPPAILPASNPIRASITPSNYPALYSKIAIQGLNPTIPINLSDMVHALVDGWKRDGEWPPKSAASAASGGVMNGVNGSFQDGVKGGADGQGHAPKRVVRRSVGRVKRALGIGSRDADAEGMNGVVDGIVEAPANRSNGSYR